MTFTAVSEDVIVQEGTFAFDYACSGTVYAGQGVYLCDTMKVKAPNTSIRGRESRGGYARGCVGVAAYGQTDGHQVAVYGPGNIVRTRISGTSVTYGTMAFLTSDGMFTIPPSSSYMQLCSGVKALALETQSTAGGETRVMLC